jgi:hypothetical protein
MGRKRKHKNTHKHRDLSSQATPRKLFWLLLGLGLTVVAIGLDLIVGCLQARQDYNSFRCTHPYYHHGFRPKMEATTEWGGLRYQVITNSLGLRDSSMRDVAKKPDGRRAILLGDSFLEGMGLEFEDTVAGVLSSQLASKGIEILNASAASYSPKVYLNKARFLFEERGIEAEELFVFIDISDIQDELNYRTFEPALWSEVEPPVGFRQRWANQSAVGRSIEEMKRKKRAISNQFDFKKMADIDVWISNVEAYQQFDNPQDAENGRWHWTVDKKLFEAWGRAGLELCAQHLRQLKMVCQNNSTRLTLLVYPAPLQLFANDKDSIQVRFWQQFCSEENIEFIDLFPLFINADFSNPQEVYDRYFLPGDTHWNAAGNALVAAELIRLRFQ